MILVENFKSDIENQKPKFKNGAKFDF